MKEYDMGLVSKIAVAAVALGVLASPSATSTVLGRAHDAFASVRHEAASEMAALHSGTGRKVRRSSTTESAHPGRSHDFRFTVTDSKGRPGRWNPCQSEPIVVNLAHAPAHAMRDLRKAVARLDAASGLRFKIVGTTTATPTASWGQTQWGSRPGWAPVLIAFARPGVGNLGEDGSSGVTTPVWVSSGGSEVFVSAEVIFNSQDNPLYRAGFHAANDRGELFEHELGHLAGLDHVTDRSQVMYPQTGYARQYGAGDLAGLRALGSGGCLEVPTPSWG